MKKFRNGEEVLVSGLSGSGREYFGTVVDTMRGWPVVQLRIGQTYRFDPKQVKRVSDVRREYEEEAERRRPEEERAKRSLQRRLRQNRLYQIRVEIFEAATNYAYPIVTHFFTGRTREEAEGYHEAHRRADDFLRSCEDKEVFQRNVKCRARYSAGWIERS